MSAASGCQNTGRYSQHHDSAPTHIPDSIVVSDAEPRFEPYRQANSRPYTVLGKHYTPMLSAKGYEQSGIASWYGQKFHGHLTSNGEAYDMFAMSAAHKTLPLPSYVKVSNLENGLTAIVRVNDRGPFHDNRVIDLSYAAALKLGVLDTGTARVKLEAIHVAENGNVTVGNGSTMSAAQYANRSEPAQQQKALFIQVAALQDESKANKLARGLETLYQVPSKIPDDGALFRLRLGPLNSEEQAEEVLEDLQNNGYSGAYKIYAAP